MENLLFHKQKIYTLFFAALILVSMFFPWFRTSANISNLSNGGGGFINGGIGDVELGFKSWGYLALLGVIIIGAASLKGEKQKEFDTVSKRNVIIGFGIVLLAPICYIIKLLGYPRNAWGSKEFASLGPGLFLGLAAGAIGLLWIISLQPWQELTTLFRGSSTVKREKSQIESKKQQHSASIQSPKTNQSIIIEQLEKLQIMKQDGLISEEEYQKMKNKIISSID